jgi:type I restriction enzyme, S subunit
MKYKKEGGSSTWRRVRVENVCEKVSVGIVIQPTQYYVTSEAGIKAFRSANVGENRIVDRDWVYLSQKGHEANLKSELKAGDVLVVRSGAPGTACVVTDKYAGSNCIDVVFARPRKTELIPEYLAEFTNSPVGRRHVLGTQGGLALKHFNVGAYKNLELFLPSLNEQRKIIDLIATWHRAIDLTEKLIAEKQLRRKGLMQQLLTGKLRLPGFGKPAIGDNLPEGWQRPKTEEIFQNISRKNRPGETVLSVTQDEGVVPRASLDRKINMDHENTHTYKLVKPGDFVISLRSFQGGLEYSRHRGLVSPAYHVIRAKVDISDDFYRHYFKSPEFIQRLAIATIGIRDGKQISYGDFSFMRLPAPPVKEQHAIAEVINQADHEIELLQTKADSLREQKKGLMQQLLTGKKRVKV